MAYSIPRRVADLLLRIVAVDKATFEKIVASLTDAQPILYPDDFVARAKEQLSDLGPDSVDAVVRCAMSLALSRNNVPGKTAKEKAVEIVNGLVEKASLDVPALVARVKKLLNIETVTLVAKAFEVLFESPCQLLETRVLSDIRPIFADRAVGTPVAGMIVHALKIAYQGDRERHEFFVALDAKDIEDLIKCLKRALAKDAALSTTLKSSGIPQIEIVGRGTD